MTRDAAGFAVTRPWPAVEPEPTVARLRAQFPAAAAELELTQRVATELAEALRGERDPMQLLFPGGSLDDRRAPLSRFADGAVLQRPGGRGRRGRGGDARAAPLRILEIGAGTGGTTAHVLPRLPAGGVEYTFTDVGPLFVARARERFARCTPACASQVLDLERDLVAQGFAAGQLRRRDRRRT